MRRTAGDTDQVWRRLHASLELRHYALGVRPMPTASSTPTAAPHTVRQPTRPEGDSRDPAWRYDGTGIAPLPEQLTAERLLSTAQAGRRGRPGRLPGVIAVVRLATGAGPSPLWWAEAAVATVTVISSCDRLQDRA